MNDDFEERRRRAHATIVECQETIQTLLSDRQIFGRFADAVNASVAVRQTWFPSAIARWYSQSVLMALRRLGDQNKRTNSLRVLFDEMIACPEAWSFESVLALWRADDSHGYSDEQLRFLLRGTYSSFVFDSGWTLLVPRVEADRARLQGELQHVKTLVDKELAHKERDWTPLQLTYDDLNRAIDALHELVLPYVRLITGAGFSDLTPIDQYEWWRIFNPWATVTPFPTDGDE